MKWVELMFDNGQDIADVKRSERSSDTDLFASVEGFRERAVKSTDLGCVFACQGIKFTPYVPPLRSRDTYLSAANP